MTTATSQTATLGASAAGRARTRAPVRFWKSGLLLGAATSCAVTVWILVVLGGFDYYSTPLPVRAYSAQHRVLRPSGPIGQTLGVAGAALMLVPLAYAARKRFKWMRNAGSQKTWLEVHLFCGVVGPVLVTFHTAFKFNGIVSAAYWSAVLVMLSGFAGRFLYVRIPRSLRGVELTRAELDARSSDLARALTNAAPSQTWKDRLDMFVEEAQPDRLTLRNLLIGEFALGRRLRRLERELAGAGVPVDIRRRALSAVVERATLLRRTAYLNLTKRLFAMWHVFHLPLVWLLLAIVAAHVAVTLYLGYVPFRW